MILLHHLGREHDQFVLNCDLVYTVEATPDTTLWLTTGKQIMVSETVEEVVDAIRGWRADLLAEALGEIKPSTRLHSR
jgi:flagellar protein FlbD